MPFLAYLPSNSKNHAYDAHVTAAMVTMPLQATFPHLSYTLFERCITEHAIYVAHHKQWLIEEGQTEEKIQFAQRILDDARKWGNVIKNARLVNALVRCISSRAHTLQLMCNIPLGESNNSIMVKTMAVSEANAKRAIP